MQFWTRMHRSTPEAGAFPLAMQAGLVHFTRSIAEGLAGRGVRLACLCPQPVDTPMVGVMKGLGLPLPETGASLLTPARVRMRAHARSLCSSTLLACSRRRGCACMRMHSLCSKYATRLMCSC